MAAAPPLPEPGTEYGPCGPYADSCDHRDCQATREMAAAVCHYCQTAIGYASSWYRDPYTGTMTHQRCHLRAIERERAR